MQHIFHLKNSAIFLFFELVVVVTTGMAQGGPLWMRYPAISPDGKTIAFSFKGDIYTVSSRGGQAVPITLHPAHDFMPVWSADGNSIAFASDRYGNFDVYLMPKAGGAPKRLTFHSSSDYPWSFSPDGKMVLFSSSRTDRYTNMQFPSGVLSELYAVPIDGKRPLMILTTPAERAVTDPSGRYIAYHDRKGYEDPMRKHHHSSIARDVWVYDSKTRKHIKITSYDGEDRNPLWVSGSEDLYYLSERSGSFNIYKINWKSHGEPKQLTSFEKHPIRHLTVSDDKLFCFTWNGELYTFREGSEPRKVGINLNADNRLNDKRILPVKGGATEFTLSPNGKEVAYVFRGEIFVSAVEGDETKRITNTPEQERSVSFSPDGRKLLYAGERNKSWNVYQCSIIRNEEQYFYSSTVLKEEPVVTSEKETFQPAYSPDGKEVAFLEDRTILKVINLETKKERTILDKDKNYSYSDGDQYYQWSPDGKWFLVTFLQPKQWISQAGLVDASGNGNIYDLTQSGYEDYHPKWEKEGKMMIWFSDRNGMRSHGSWGSQNDVYGMFFTKEAYDRFKLSKDDYALLKEQEKKEKKKEEENKDETGKGKKKRGAKVETGKDTLTLVNIEFNGLRDRLTRLTINSSNLGDAVLSADGEKLYYLAKFEKGYDLWQTQLRTKETKILAKLNSKSGGQLYLDEAGKKLFLLSNGTIVKISVEDGKKENVKIKGEMVLRPALERDYLFEHIWRQVKEKFYRVDMQNVDWVFYKNTYIRFLPFINNNYDFAEMLSEMLGELNASHTGCRYAHNTPEGDVTASLGIFIDEKYTGDGVRIAEVMKNGPCNKSESKIKAGVIIEKIDGITIDAGMNYYPLLNRKKGKNTLLSLSDPASGMRWDETVKPISMGEEEELRYKRWVKKNRTIVDKLSNRKMGYVHVRSMNDASFRTIYKEVLGLNANKDALVVDTRFNGGGWLHDDLATFLSGRPYLTFLPRGQDLGTEPQFKWRKPSVVIMSESNYSDAHMFPYTYKVLGIGKLIGMPVPGTGTAVWWEQLIDKSLVFGIPQVGTVTNDGKYLENTQLEPDIKVSQKPEEIAEGTDRQLEKAIESLLEGLK